jgi:hypothetical protein
MGRTVTLVLIDAEGTLRGLLAPFSVHEPWWQGVASVVAAAKECSGLDLTVLRLLSSEHAQPPSGAVSYLALLGRGALAIQPHLELAPVPAPLADLALRPEPLRAAWATLAGPAQSLAWASATLAELGRELISAEQQRSWNLSATWRIECRDAAGRRSSTWLKQVPPFFAHEASVLRWLGEHAPGTAVPLLASDGLGRALLEHVEGEDAYGSGVAERESFAGILHRLQTVSLAHIDDLLARGLPDRRGASLIDYVRRALITNGADLSAVAGLLDDLPARMAAVRSCGIDDTLVHGDFHPGNVRRHGSSATLIDWSDSFIGHPALDLLRLTDGCNAEQARALRHAWSERWRAHAPRAEPERAIELLRPVCALRHAALFADICAQIEPTERPYHASDVPRCLEEAAALWHASARP